MFGSISASESLYHINLITAIIYTAANNSTYIHSYTLILYFAALFYFNVYFNSMKGDSRSLNVAFTSFSAIKLQKKLLIIL